MRRLHLILTLAVPLSLIAAYTYGLRRNDSDATPFLQQAAPEADVFDERGGGVFDCVQVADSERQVIGRVAIGQGAGYGGPIRIAVALDPVGNVTGLSVVEHQESNAFYKKVVDSDLADSFQGKSYADPFQLGEDLDGVSGATMTSQAMADAVSDAARQIAATEPDWTPPPPLAAEPFQFGLLEITLLLLFGVAFVPYSKERRWTQIVRWTAILTSLVLLGFWFNTPVTLANVNSLLLGFFPSWRAHLGLCLLLIIALLWPLATGKTPYCKTVCPFGAAQQCLNAASGAKRRVPARWNAAMRWIPRLLCWGAILYALAMRDPARSSYEPYGALFGFTGTTFQFAFAALILITSLFVVRPWCNYLCPLHGATDCLRTARRLVLRRSDPNTSEEKHITMERQL
jgi:NosR/NirI family transcriptional regulator, nitrous oxide reductase regulator